MFWSIEKLVGKDSGLFSGADRRLITYEELLEDIGRIENLIESQVKALVTIFCDNSPASLAAYLAVLRAGHAALLVNASTDVSLKQRILETYSPEVVIYSGCPAESADNYDAGPMPLPGLSFAFIKKQSNTSIHADTALLLSTSGTTGSQKLVRLSYANIQSNAESIAEYLDISKSETTVTSLPMSYSYGLSVINSHLLAGANIVCTNGSILTRDFWTLFNERRCTTFAGVPFTYAMLERLRFDRMNLPSLKTITEAGGKLSPEKVELFAGIAKQKGYRFFVMYGQTEATARMSYLPPEKALEKPDSVGLAIPGGMLRIVRNDKEVDEPDVAGEVFYEGPNVMLGYAETRKCLSQGDVMRGMLRTGDVGYRDPEGYLYISGRLRRFIKLYGLRLNLDDFEHMLESELSCSVACVGDDDRAFVLIESADNGLIARAREAITRLYQLHHSAVEVYLTASMPVTTSGKKDYTTINKEMLV